MNTESQQAALQDDVAREIERIAQEAFDGMIAAIQDGTAPLVAIAAATAGFTGAYYVELSKAFTATLDRFVGVAEVRDWPVAGVTLSKALYANTKVAELATMNAINTHLKEIAAVRDLAMALYDGYDSGIDVLGVKNQLPAYLNRDLLLKNEVARKLAKASAEKLKTKALRAAYMQYLDEMEKKAADGILYKALDVAFNERARYYSNRIAQTELMRSYASKKDTAMIDDEGIEFVKWSLSATHPEKDICDYHASVDLYGLGKGVYPKNLAPRRPAHPHCKCIKKPVYALNGATPAPNPEAGNAYLRSLHERDAAKVMGSRDKLQRTLDGESLYSVLNGENTPEGYGYLLMNDKEPFAKT